MPVGQTMNELIDATCELSALPATSTRLLELLDDLTVEADKVAAVIGKDPALTANLLKLCNSAYYGVRRQVGSVKEALVLLGNKTVVTLAFATSMGDVLRGELKAYGLGGDEVWRHALAVAIGASQLVTEVGARELSDRAFTAGLVHDIGKLLLNDPLARKIGQLPADISGREITALERRTLGFDHGEAGAALATAWNFPQMLASAILHHHRPEEGDPDNELQGAVYAANLVAESLGLGAPVTPISLAEFEVLAELGLPQDALDRLAGQLARHQADLASVLERSAS